MDDFNLYMISRKIMSKNKGILASDERASSLNKKLKELGIEESEENRRRLRELFINTSSLEKYLNGIILSEETIMQNDSNGTPFTEILNDKDVLIGVKVDEGTAPLSEGSEEKITNGLDKLDGKLGEYFDKGARFTKWRSVIKIGENMPSDECLQQNSEIMAEYASIVQNHNMVPVVEPEVLMNGTHDIETSKQVNIKVLKTLFSKLDEKKVDIKAVILKTSMVINGTDNKDEVHPEQIAQYTIDTLLEAVPTDVPGIVFLSGGQSSLQATKNFDAIAKIEHKSPLPWELAFSFLRAIEQPALEIWQGKEDNVKKAREVFKERLKMNSLADRGLYSIS
jgi:fructose-bisphosphate aldolase class I